MFAARFGERLILSLCDVRLHICLSMDYFFSPKTEEKYTYTPCLFGAARRDTTPPSILVLVHSGDSPSVSLCCSFCPSDGPSVCLLSICRSLSFSVCLSSVCLSVFLSLYCKFPWKVSGFYPTVPNSPNVYPLMDPGGPGPPCFHGFFQFMQISGKTPYFEQNLGSGPPCQKSAWPSWPKPWIRACTHRVDEFLWGLSNTDSFFEARYVDRPIKGIFGPRFAYIYRPWPRRNILD